MDLQQALDLMRQVRAGPRVSQSPHPSQYFVWVATEDGKSFEVEVYYNAQSAFVLEDAAEAREYGFL